MTTEQANLDINVNAEDIVKLISTMQALADAMNKADTATEGAGDAADKLGDEAKAAAGDVGKLDNQMKGVGRTGNTVTSGLKSMAAGLVGAYLSVETLKKGFDILKNSLTGYLERNQEAKASAELSKQAFEDLTDSIWNNVLGSEGLINITGQLTASFDAMALSMGDATDGSTEFATSISGGVVTALQVAVNVFTTLKNAVTLAEGAFEALKLAAEAQVDTIVAIFSAMAGGIAVILENMLSMGSNLAQRLGMDDTAESMRNASQTMAAWVETLGSISGRSAQDARTNILGIGQVAIQTAEDMTTARIAADDLNQALESSRGARSNRTARPAAGGGGEASVDSNGQQRTEDMANRMLADLLAGQAEVQAARLASMQKDWDERLFLDQEGWRLTAEQQAIAQEKLKEQSGSAEQSRYETAAKYAGMGVKVAESIGNSMSAVFSAEGAEEQAAARKKMLNDQLQMVGNMLVAELAARAIANLAIPTNIPIGIAQLAAVAGVKGALAGVGVALTGGSKANKTKPVEDRRQASMAGGPSTNTVITNNFGIVGDPRATARMVGDQVRTGNQYGYSPR